MISFHNYDWPEVFRRGSIRCAAASAADLHGIHGAGEWEYVRYILPIAKKERVAAINWGLVAGKTQTYFPWDSWERPYVGAAADDLVS